jgi:hypothetical protein
MIKRPCLLPWSCARQRFADTVSLATDPLEHGAVYYGTRVRGVIIGRPR